MPVELAKYILQVNQYMKVLKFELNWKEKYEDMNNHHSYMVYTTDFKGKVTPKSLLLRLHL